MPRTDDTTAEQAGSGAGQPLPTVELHRHFEAGIRPEMIARLAARHHLTEARTRAGVVVPGIDPQDPDAIRRYYRTIAAGFGAPDGFARFADSFGLPLSVLRSLDDLEEAVFDQLIDCAAAGSLHTELRGSPFTYREHLDAPVEAIAAALVRGVDRAWDDRGVSATFILAFSRQKGLAAPDAVPEHRQARIVAALASALHRSDRLVGLDIAGFPELPYPPGLFEDALRPAREAGVPLTVHAGEQGRAPRFENAPPWLIVEAIERLGARRIGHGTSLAASAAARAFVRERGVAIECCPVSNDCMGFVAVAGHPLRMLLDEGILASLATDDPLMFGPWTVRETFNAIAGPLGLRRADLLQLTRNGIESAFVTEARRDVLRRRLAEATSGGVSAPSA
jgi:adenosine deaminase